MQTDTGPTWGLRDSLIVQKYGGSSVADSKGIRRVAQRIVEKQRAGYSVVVVLSAMGNTTNELLALAAEVGSLGPSRELDLLLSRGEQISIALLAIAVSRLGAKPHVFTGEEAGLTTNGTHGDARIVAVDPEPLRESLALREIPIVAGFQGTSRGAHEVTTLGRGGSDLTAVALAASLNARVCEIYSDVDGVYTADPRIVPKARKTDIIPSVQMMELAAGGAQVLQLRCIEYARRLGVSIHVRSSFNPSEGTLIVCGPGAGRGVEGAATLEEPVFMGVTTDRSQRQVTVAGIPREPGAMARIFGAAAAAGVCADMIAHTPVPGGNGMDISFILQEAKWPAVAAALREVQGVVGFHSVTSEEVGKISLMGFGMRDGPAVICRFLSVLSDVGIRVRLFSDSVVVISAVTELGMLSQGADAIREEFSLSGEWDNSHGERHVKHAAGHARWGS